MSGSAFGHGAQEFCAACGRPRLPQIESSRCVIERPTQRVVSDYDPFA